MQPYLLSSMFPHSSLCSLTTLLMQFTLTSFLFDAEQFVVGTGKLKAQVSGPVVFNVRKPPVT